MGAGILIAVLLALAAPVFGGQARQLCLTCHPVHLSERGRCIDCHLGNSESTRKNIAHSGLRAGKFIRFTVGDAVQVKKGDLLLEQFACRRCHVSDNRGNRLAVSLDAAANLKTGEELAASIRRPVENMPDFGLSEDQITILVNALYYRSNSNNVKTGKPDTVHFNMQKNKKTDVFTRKCAPCHRVLSERLGALGTGNIGPNLSGILTPNYPQTFKGKAAWSAQSIKTWLSNPRKIYPWSRMLPITLTDSELKDLTTILQTL